MPAPTFQYFSTSGRLVIISYGPSLIILTKLMQPLSILCRSLKDIDTYTMGFPRGDGHGYANVFRAIKQCLPGPVRYSVTLMDLMHFLVSKLVIIRDKCEQYTFILTASKELPKQCVGYGTTNVKYACRKNVGVRISDDAICQAILQAMDAPLICTSVKGPKENEWMIDPTTIGDIYRPEGLDFVVDGGVRVAEPSTIVDMTGPYPKVLREGKAEKPIDILSHVIPKQPPESASVVPWVSSVITASKS